MPLCTPSSTKRRGRNSANNAYMTGISSDQAENAQASTRIQVMLTTSISISSHGRSVTIGPGAG